MQAVQHYFHLALCPLRDKCTGQVLLQFTYFLTGARQELKGQEYDWIPFLIGFLLAIFGTLVAVTTSGAQDMEPTVLVRRVVPANFHDPNFDQAKFDNLLKNSASRMAIVEPNSTVSSLLKKQYNIIKSWTPAVYDMLEADILTKARGQVLH